MSKDSFLSEQFDILSENNVFNPYKEIPAFVKENLNPAFELRPYQIEAFSRFNYYMQAYPNKKFPMALLFNMATGSGKTLIMSGLMLYLYKRGYRNFLFFVNSNNIIEKTKDNFLNSNSIKYLFNNKIDIDGRVVNIRAVDNFDGVSNEDINVCFTTIQKLHGDLHLEKENSLTFENFKDKKIVLLADEAHHGQVKTKQKIFDEKPNWENTIEKILEKNKENILLEFTATMGFQNNKEIKEKYIDRLIYKYDLVEFRNDGFSKDVEIFKVDEEKEYRILTAILINQYRQDIASKYGLKHFKPVILFKSTKEIKESLENHRIFRELIDNLKVSDLEKIKGKSNESTIKKLFNFYDREGISLSNLIKKLQINFAEKNCLNVNEENLDKKTISKKDKGEVLVQQNILNSLEDKNNPIRAIFAVHKLNEGWDVLNLFDIVRISDKQASGGSTKGRISPSTISEAQLVGRGARYYPFRQDDSQEKFKRKFDEDLENDLRILEELFFHCHSTDKGRYVAELKQALVEKGLMDDDTEEVKLNLKESFKKTNFYKTGKIYINERVKKDYSKIDSFEKLGFKDRDFEYEIYSGKEEKTDALKDDKYDSSKINKITITIPLKEIEQHIIKNALSKIDFFEFKVFQRYFPSTNSINDLIKKKEFLLNLNIKFLGIKEDLNNLSNKQKFKAVYSLLVKIKDSLQGNLVEYQGSKVFVGKDLSEIFTDKILKLDKKSPRFESDKEYLKDKDWYVFNANYGTSEERACVRFIERLIKEDLDEKYEEIYLIRNELHFRIYDFEDGQAFAPDFVLFLKTKGGKSLTYQIFIEPKGNQFRGGDGTFEAGKEGWKQKFLRKIKENFKSKDLMKFIETNKYKVTGIRFYNEKEENYFKDELVEVLN